MSMSAVVSLGVPIVGNGWISRAGSQDRAMLDTPTALAIAEELYELLWIEGESRIGDWSVESRRNERGQIDRFIVTNWLLGRFYISRTQAVDFGLELANMVGVTRKGC
ncbi:hypothetical protein [Caudoviricetes sp.]|nr:hypothetical protein [Caudoviricetes sp.]